LEASESARRALDWAAEEKEHKEDLIGRLADTASQLERAMSLPAGKLEGQLVKARAGLEQLEQEKVEREETLEREKQQKLIMQDRMNAALEAARLAATHIGAGTYNPATGAVNFSDKDTALQHHVKEVKEELKRVYLELETAQEDAVAVASKRRQADARATKAEEVARDARGQVALARKLMEETGVVLPSDSSSDWLSAETIVAGDTLVQVRVLRQQVNSLTVDVNRLLEEKAILIAEKTKLIQDNTAEKASITARLTAEKTKLIHDKVSNSMLPGCSLSGH
jgi:hypothetical protein